MSLEDDIMKSQQELLAKAQAPSPFIGRVVSADPDPLQVVVEGTSVALPALSFSSDVLTPGLQVAVLPIGPKYVVLGALGTAVEPEPEIDTEKAACLTVDTAYGTTATTILTLPLDIGTWAIRVEGSWERGSATDQHIQLDFSGTATGALSFQRWTSSASAGEFEGGLGAEVNQGQTTPQGFRFAGTVVVTAAGDLQLKARRTAGDTASVHAGASIIAVMA
jgi:hypothetical protein